MRKSGLIALLALSSCFTAALAQDVPKGFKRYDVGGGVKLDLPKKWAFQTYPMPLEGATNIRITKGELRMAITGFPLPEQSAQAPTEDNSAETLKMAMAPYLPVSKEGKVEAIVIANGMVHGSYGTLSSSNGDPAFSIFAGRMYSCVTTAVVRAPGMAFSISIGSTSCTGEDHQAAVRALTGLQSGG